MIKCLIRILGLCLLLTCTHAQTQLLSTNSIEEPVKQSQENYNALEPKPAVPAILEALKSNDLIAIGEYHDTQQLYDFYFSLLDNDQFVDTVDDIVIESGNSLYQGILDQYVSGQEVDETEFSRLWLDLTNSLIQSGNQTSIKSLLDKVRQVNKNLPQQDQLRVLAGNAPLDWDSIKSSDQFYHILGNSDRDYARIVQTNVINKGRKAIMIIGSDHIKRNLPNPPSINLIETLEANSHQPVFVIHTYLKSLADEIAYEEPLIIPIKGTKIGDERNQSGHPQIKYESQIDAVLYVGAPRDFVSIKSEPFDENWIKELDKRSQVINGRNHKFLTNGLITDYLSNHTINETKIWFEELIKENPDRYDISSMFFIMQAYSDLGIDYVERAIAVMEIGLDYHPTYWNMHDTLGELYWKQGDYKKAVMYYENSLKYKPDNENALKMIETIKAEM